MHRHFFTRTRQIVQDTFLSALSNVPNVSDFMHAEGLAFHSTEGNRFYILNKLKRTSALQSLQILSNAEVNAYGQNRSSLF